MIFFLIIHRFRSVRSRRGHHDPATPAAANRVTDHSSRNLVDAPDPALPVAYDRSGLYFIIIWLKLRLGSLSIEKMTLERNARNWMQYIF